MNRLLTSLAAAAAVLTTSALVLFALGGVGCVVAGSVVGVIAVPVWLATFGLIRDPQARVAVAARMAAARGEAVPATVVRPARGAAPAEPVGVEAEATQGFTVGARRPRPQDRRTKSSGGRRR